MKRKDFIWFFAVAIIGMFSGCASSNNGHTGVQYPPTQQVETIFQLSQSPASCRIFAHLFATMPAKMTTRDFSQQITAEAKSKGADLVFVGQSRQCRSESSLGYSYYGPVQEYRIQDWHGWSFGGDEWTEQGNWAAIGYEEWLKGEAHYDYPVVMQVAFIRCQG